MYVVMEIIIVLIMILVLDVGYNLIWFESFFVIKFL